MIIYFLEDVCPECGHQALYDEQRGETVCPQCGLVISEKNFDYSVRKFDQYHASIVSDAVLDKGLGGLISEKNIDGTGQYIKDTPGINRIRKWDRRPSMKGEEYPKYHRLGWELSRFYDILQLDYQVREETTKILKGALKREITRGRSFRQIAAGAIYIALRIKDVPKSLEEIEKKIFVPKEKITRAARIIIKVLGLRTKQSTPFDYIPKISNELKISTKTQHLAASIIKEAQEKGITQGKSPLSVAGAALYIACLKNGEKKTQRQFSKASGVTEATIRNRYKEIERNIKI